MVVLARFYRDAKDWTLIEERLRLTPCPHCKRVGTLNRHGYLLGFDECHRHVQTVRARRIYCSNRNLRPGCGRTFSIWLADKIKRLSLTTNGLWRFLLLVVRKRLSTAIRCFECHLSDRTLQRIWNRFRLGQSQIRAALLGLCKPPVPAAEFPSQPESQVLLHLQAAFPTSTEPITAFQHSLQTFFL